MSVVSGYLLRAAVHSSLDSALANGYEEFVRTAPVAMVAEDLKSLDAALSTYEIEELEPHVLSWRAQKSTT